MLQCNLTSMHGVHQESFWMKNGEEMAETRTSNINIEYRSVCAHVCLDSAMHQLTRVLLCRLNKPRGDDAGVYMCVYTFQGAPAANATIEVRCKCWFVSFGGQFGGHLGRQ